MSLQKESVSEKLLRRDSEELKKNGEQLKAIRIQNKNEWEREFVRRFVNAHGTHWRPLRGLWTEEVIEFIYEVISQREKEIAENGKCECGYVLVCEGCDLTPNRCECPDEEVKIDSPLEMDFEMRNKAYEECKALNAWYCKFCQEHSDEVSPGCVCPCHPLDRKRINHKRIFVK